MVIESNPISSPPPHTKKKKKRGNLMGIFHFYFTPYTFSVGVVTDLNFLKFQMLQIKP